MKKIVTLAVAVLMVVALFSGISSSPKPSSSTTASTSSTAAKITLGFYWPCAHPYFTAAQPFITQWSKDNGIQVITKVGPDWTQDSENQQVEALSAEGIAGLAVYPCDASGANGLYSQLVSNDINVVNFATTTVQPTKASFAVATDVKQAAYNACEQLITLMGGKGDIINVLEVLTDPNTVLRKEGIDACVAAHQA